MDLSEQHEAAKAAVSQWLDTGFDHPVFRLFGFAGTGKTTIAKQLASEVAGRVVFAAYTGKAAHVLQSKGCKDAQTIHSLIYQPKSKSKRRLDQLRGEVIRAENLGEDPDRLRELQAELRAEEENLARPAFSLKLDSELRGAALLVLDEVSMVNAQIAQDLMSFDVPILALGDPAQLPPVEGTGYFVNEKADFLLDEVHRQAKGSKVLQLATDVRRGESLAGWNGSLLVPKGALSIGDLAGFDQVLVGRNKSRTIVNRQMREHLGTLAELPQKGERLICTRNDHDLGLLNGSQWIVEEAIASDDGDETVHLQLVSAEGDGRKVGCWAHSHPLGIEEEKIPFHSVREAQCFQYAYAMTVHKAQGSQWDRVCLIDEAWCFPAADRRAWRYTGVTRAASDIVVVKS